eukprot:5996338-Amphidinium_carterae.3
MLWQWGIGANTFVHDFGSLAQPVQATQGVSITRQRVYHPSVLVILTSPYLKSKQPRNKEQRTQGQDVSIVKS